MSTNSGFYSRYEELKAKAGKTDYAIAKDTGISAVTLSDWKKGLYTPKADKLFILAKYFGVPMEYFLE